MYSERKFCGYLKFLRIYILDIPDPPGKPLVMGFTSRSVNLSWAPPISAHNSPISHYLIHVREGEDGRWTNEMTEDGEVNNDVSETNDNKTRYTVVELKPFTTYSFRVVAVNAMGRSKPSRVSYYMLTLREGEYYSARIQKYCAVK